MGFLVCAAVDVVGEMPAFVAQMISAVDAVGGCENAIIYVQ